MDDSKLATGEGRSTVTSTCIQNGAGVLKPQGGAPADVDAEERKADNRRSLTERMIIGTWNVRTMSQGKLDIMKRESERERDRERERERERERKRERERERELERTGVERMGISEMRWTRMGHFMSDEYEVYYCGQDTLRRNGVVLRRNGVVFICTDEIRRCVMDSTP